MSHQMWVVGTKPGPAKRAVCALNCWAMSMLWVSSVLWINFSACAFVKIWLYRLLNERIILCVLLKINFPKYEKSAHDNWLSSGHSMATPFTFQLSRLDPSFVISSGVPRALEQDAVLLESLAMLWQKTPLVHYVPRKQWNDDWRYLWVRWVQHCLWIMEGSQVNRDRQHWCQHQLSRLRF